MITIDGVTYDILTNVVFALFMLFFLVGGVFTLVKMLIDDLQHMFCDNQMQETQSGEK